jgi:hypothetical protein
MNAARDHALTSGPQLLGAAVGTALCPNPVMGVVVGWALGAALVTIVERVREHHEPAYYA